MTRKTGIVFAGGEGPAPEAVRRACGHCADALVVAADSGLLLAEAAGLAPDWVVGDMDSLGGDHPSLLRYPASRIERHDPDKDLSDTELALNVLWDQGCLDAWIVGGGGGRLAHILAIRDLFERERAPRRWLTAGEDARRVDPGETLRAELEPGDVVSVFPLGGGPWKAESGGLKWELGGARWERGLHGISNVALGRDVEIRAAQGRFLAIMEVTCLRR